MGDRGIPSYCRCGERVRLLTSRTSTNPGRLFHSCGHGDERNRYHLFKWTDESVVEEIEDMKPKLNDLERASSILEKGLQLSESEIENLTMETRTCEAVIRSFEKEMRGFEKEVRGFEKEVEDCKMELRGLKNMVMFVVVIAILYKFVM